jgi:hypothetical protein
VAVGIGGFVGRDDWFRNTDWNLEIEAAFFRRLRGARINKSQYLRIQASYLSKSHPRVALRLLDEYFLLGEHFDLAQAYADKAAALVTLDEIDAALSSYEDALKREREFTGLKSESYLGFAVLVANARRAHLYSGALEVLDAHRNSLLFPLHRYEAHGARALILQELGYADEARSSAQLALEAASEIQSGFRYHQDVGLVADTDDEFGARIAALVN